MLFIMVVLMAAWVGLLFWFGDNALKGHTEIASLALAGAIVVSTIVSFMAKGKVLADRDPIVERTKDFLTTLIFNIIAAFFAYFLMSVINT